MKMNLPQSAHRFCQDRPILTSSSGDRGIALKDVLWMPGELITIAFLDGTIEQRNNFQLGLQIWGQYVNLNFQIVPDINRAVVRVAHLPNQSWSEVGTNAKRVRGTQPTLSIGWDGMDIILHEIGHLLGLGHEHQNPDNQIRWNTQVLNEVLGGPPNFWTPQIIEQNIINRYSTSQIIGTQFDAQSIMLYPVDPTWTLDGFSTNWNINLSSLDIDLVKRLYPFADGVNIIKQVVTQIQDGSILISNMTDDPVTPILIQSENGDELAAIGSIFIIGLGILIGSKIIRNFSKNE